jgi:PhzF family phenazine biosynthesis protein
MELPIYQVDAFTNKTFGGNPAAVVPLDTWLPDDILLKIAAENNLSETAFLSPQIKDFIFVGLRRPQKSTYVDTQHLQHLG